MRHPCQQPNRQLPTSPTPNRRRRTYTSYACLPGGVYTVYVYDAYGDGWDGGWLAVSYLRDAATTYVLLNTTARSYNGSANLHVFSTMPATAGGAGVGVGVRSGVCRTCLPLAPGVRTCIYMKLQMPFVSHDM